MILPDLEQTPSTTRINFDIPGGSAPGNAAELTAQSTQIAAFLCPSDPDRLTSPGGPQQLRRQHRLGHRDRTATLVHGRHLRAGRPSAPRLRDPRRRSRHHRRDEPDGRLQRAGQGDRPEQRRAVGRQPARPRARSSKVARLPATPTGRRGLPRHRPSRRGRGDGGPLLVRVVLALGTMYGTRYNHVMPPNRGAARSTTPTTTAPHRRSRHPGVVNVLFADGSVKAVKSSVNLNVWRALGTRSGGEVVSASDYRPRAATAALRARTGGGQSFMKCLVAGWFSFEQMGATAGDLLAKDLVCSWVERAGPRTTSPTPPRSPAVSGGTTSKRPNMRASCSSAARSATASRSSSSSGSSPVSRSSG